MSWMQRSGMSIAIAAASVGCGSPPEPPRAPSRSLPVRAPVIPATDTTPPPDTTFTVAYVERLRLDRGVGRYVVCGRTAADSLRLMVQVERDALLPPTPVAVREGRFRTEFTLDFTTDAALAYTVDEAGLATLSLPDGAPVEIVSFLLVADLPANGDGRVQAACGG